MSHSRAAIAIAAATIVLAAGACGSYAGGTAPASGSTALKDCPSGPMSPKPAVGGPAGPGNVVPVDTGTLLRSGTIPQIHCGRTPVATRTGAVYATVPLPGGRTEQLAMDIQFPLTIGTKPLLVYVPGGGFQTADKNGNLALRTFAAEAGYVVASIQYRVQPDGATYVDSISDVKAAVRYLRAHSTTYQIDTSAVAVWGDAAGGYLAAMTGVTTGDRTYDVGDNLDQGSDVQAVVVKNIGGPAGFARANPIGYVKPTDPPFVFFHGNADTTISPSETVDLHKALRAAGVDSTCYVVDGAANGDSPQWTTPTVAGKLIDFLNQHLKR